MLCDALTYCERFEPAAVVDVATLTGACIIALGHQASALFSNQDHLSRELQAAADEAADRVWPMPMWEEYHEVLKSNFADVANVGGPRRQHHRRAFCRASPRLTTGRTWTSPAWRGRAQKKGATGRPVPLLTQFLQDRADTAAGNVVRRGRPRDDAADTSPTMTQRIDFITTCATRWPLPASWPPR